MSTATARPPGLDTRGAILDAALNLFSDRSFDGASTRAIADVAGVTQPLLNYHFAGKEELWRAAVDDLFDRFSTSMQVRLSGPRGVDAVAKLRVRPACRFHPRQSPSPKTLLCIAGPGADVPLPGDTVDWEAEIGAVIGDGESHVAVSDAWGVIPGLTLGQGISDGVTFVSGAETIGELHNICVAGAGPFEQ